MDHPLFVSLELLTPEGDVIGRYRRLGEGLRVLLMNFVLEDAWGQPVLLIRQPERGSGWRAPFRVFDPTGGQVGVIGRKGLLSSSSYLRQTNGGEITAAPSGWVWRGYSILQQGLPAAEVEMLNPFLPSRSRPSGVKLRILPSSSPSWRRFILAFVAHLTESRPVQTGVV